MAIEWQSEYPLLFPLLPCVLFFFGIPMRLQISPTHERLPWWQQLLYRAGLLIWLKAFGTMIFMGLFFWAYFSVLTYPLRPAWVMPRLTADDWFAFTPHAFPVYASLWVYVSLPPAFLGNLRALLCFGGWMAALCLCGLGIFWLVPTAVPPAGLDWSAYPEMAMIKSMDGGGNACPSLHVACAVFAAFWLGRVLRQVRSPHWLRWLNGLFGLAIAWSTLGTRQHVLLDVFAGLLLGLVFVLASLRHLQRTQQRPLL